MSDIVSQQKPPARLLLVEDDRLCLATLHSGLKDLGYEPIKVTTGKEAIELSQHKPLDLAIIDVDLPDMCGLEVGRLLYETRQLPVI